MAFIEEHRLHLGAEADVWRGTWFGKQAVRKQRRPRSWRHADLDHRLGLVGRRDLDEHVGGRRGHFGVLAVDDGRHGHDDAVCVED